MPSILSTIPTGALALNLMMPGQSLRFTDGWVHEKIVPYTILSQVLFGSYEITCQGRTESIQPGEAFLTPANQPMTIIHHGDPTQGNLMGARWNHFHFTLFDTLDLTSLLEMPLKIEAPVAGRLGSMIGELIGIDPADDSQPLKWLARRHALACEMLHALCELAPERPESHAILNQSKRLARVFTHIRDHIDESISPGQLARLIHMSLSRFHAFFREHMGCTPMDYVKSLRLNEACKLLLASGQTIAEVSGNVGFVNQFHFSREFKTRYGMTPSRYRQTHRLMQG